jgi:hypothetical protein
MMNPRHKVSHADRAHLGEEDRKSGFINQPREKSNSGTVNHRHGAASVEEPRILFFQVLLGGLCIYVKAKPWSG